MTALIDTLLLVPVYSFFAYLLPLCVLDVYYREINHWYWTPLVLVNAPVTAYLYLTGWYPWGSFVISVITCGIYLAVMRLNLLQGADFLFLIFIALFWIINPHPFPHGIQIQFYIYLLVSMLLTAGILPIVNYLEGKRSESIIEMMSTCKGGVPFMIPISLAFVLSYLVG